MTAVRLTAPYKIWPIGHIIPEMPGNLARLLISRGRAEEVGAEPKKALNSPVDRSLRASQMQLKSRR